MTVATARIRLMLLALCAAAVAVALRPRVALIADATRPHAWVARAGADQVAGELAQAVLWCVACWVLASLAVCTALASRASTTARFTRIARLTLPAPLRRLVLTATGVALMLSPAVASAAAPTTTTAHAQASVGATPAWPTDTPLPTPVWPSESNRPTPTPVRPSHTTTPAKPAPTKPAPTSTAPTNTAPTNTAPAKPAPAPGVVTVRPGDSLWTIAADHLQTITSSPASRTHVARAWPAWFAANRAVIGDDPSLIRPGEQLHVPVASQHDHPTANTDHGAHR